MHYIAISAEKKKPLRSSFKFFGTFLVADGSTSLHRTIS